MLYFKCKIKGNIDSGICAECYIKQNPKLAASRVICKKDNVVEQLQENIPKEEKELINN